MAFWKSKPKVATAAKSFEDSASEILFLGEESAPASEQPVIREAKRIADDEDLILDMTAPVDVPPAAPAKPAPKPAKPTAMVEALVLDTPSDARSLRATAEELVKATVTMREAPTASAHELGGPLPASTESPIMEPLTQAIEPVTQKKKFSFRDLRLSLKRNPEDEPGFLAEWRRGAKGRPSQLFIGFMPDIGKKDAISYAIGIAQRHGINSVNCAYAVFKHNTGYAYEVHEGGPRRAYLPAILKTFDEQMGGPIIERSLVTIETAQRRVRIERTQAGLTAFLMPESFEEPQSDWLEPGPKTTPAVPLLKGFVFFGGAVFTTGLMVLVTTLLIRPEPQPLNAPARLTITYESLPISQWPNLLNAYSDGYSVDALKLKGRSWVIARARAGEAPVDVPSNGAQRVTTPAAPVSAKP